MKALTILLTAGLLSMASAQSSDTQQAPPKKVTKVPDQPTIPKDATPLPDGSYRYVDKNGKKWIYRSTPFGVSKAEERPVAPVTQNPADDPAKSEDLGDSVRFTRPTPFGPKVWTKKKTDLDSYEKTIWDRDHPKPASTQNPAPTDDAKPADAPKDAAKQD